MTTRTWLVIAVIIGYFYWVNQSEAQLTQAAAAGTPVGTTPVSSIATMTVASTSTGNPVQNVINGLSNLVNHAPTRSGGIIGVPAKPIYLSNS